MYEIHREQEEMQSILLQNIQAYHAAKASFLTQFNNAKIQHRVHTWLFLESGVFPKGRVLPRIHIYDMTFIRSKFKALLTVLRYGLIFHIDIPK